MLITNPDQLSGGKQIVGYIEKRGYLDMGDRYAVTGPVEPYGLADAIPVNEVGVSPAVRRNSEKPRWRPSWITLPVVRR